MRTISSNIAILAGLSFVCGSTLIASVPQWLRGAAQTGLTFKGDPTEIVLLDERTTTVTPTGEVSTRYRRAYKILHPLTAGEKVLAVRFDHETRLTYLKAWGLLPDGQEREVGERDALESRVSSDSLYEDASLKVLELPLAEPGAVVGYEYEQKRRSGISQDIWNFQKDVPIRVTRFELQLPQHWAYKANWVNHTPIEPKSLGENHWLWELENVPAIDHEQNMPAWDAIAGWVGLSFYGPTASLPIQGNRCWRDVGIWYARLAAERSKSDASIRQKVLSLTASAPTTMDKIRIVAAFVQTQIRYVAVEIGIGGYQSHAAGEVFNKSYGDCKDKATLLRAMLADIDVDSYYVLVNADRGVVAADFPSMLSFNHVILAIRLPGDTPLDGLWCAKKDPNGFLLYFDPTDYLPMGLLPESLQTSYGLRVSETGGELEQLPLIASAANRLQRTAKVSVMTSGGIKADVSEIRSGALAGELRTQLLTSSAAERCKTLESFLARFIGNNTLKSFSIENLENQNANLILHYSFEAPSYAKRAGNLMFIPTRLLGEKAAVQSENKEPRHYPFEFPYTSLESDDIELIIPAGYVVDEVPPCAEIATQFGAYHSGYAQAGQVMHFSRSFRIEVLRLPVEQWDELRRFNLQIAEDERNQLVLKTSF